ncbi:hypothetical protein AN1V17_51360 [Vallitalea sediminicola]
MYKHVIWDFDRTLFNSYPLYTEVLKYSLDPFSWIDTSLL